MNASDLPPDAAPAGQRLGQNSGHNHEGHDHSTASLVFLALLVSSQVGLWVPLRRCAPGLRLPPRLSCSPRAGTAGSSGTLGRTSL